MNLMLDRKKKLLRLAFPIFFFLVISSANFLHSEKSLFEDQKCPACRLQHSTQGLELINVFVPPAPEFAGFLAPDKNHLYIIGFELCSSSRDPSPSNLNKELI
jgi:protein-disulfide isomerase